MSKNIQLSDSDSSSSEPVSKALVNNVTALLKRLPGISKTKIVENVVAPDFSLSVVINEEDKSKITIRDINIESYKRKHLTNRLNALANGLLLQNLAITSVVIYNCSDPKGRILQSLAKSSLASYLLSIQIKQSIIGRISSKIEKTDDQSSVGHSLVFPKLVEFKIEDSTVNILNIRAPSLKKEGLKVNDKKMQYVNIDAQLSYAELERIMPQNFNRTLAVDRDSVERREQEMFKRKLQNIKDTILDARLSSETYKPVLRQISDLTFKDCKSYEELAENITRIFANLSLVQGFFLTRSRSAQLYIDDNIMNFDKSMHSIFTFASELIEHTHKSLLISYGQTSLSDNQKFCLEIIKRIVDIPTSLNQKPPLNAEQIRELEEIFEKIQQYKTIEPMAQFQQQESLKGLLNQAQEKIDNLLGNISLDSPKEEGRSPPRSLQTASATITEHVANDERKQ
jgi:hypothetical protein